MCRVSSSHTLLTLVYGPSTGALLPKRNQELVYFGETSFLNLTLSHEKVNT